MPLMPPHRCSGCGQLVVGRCPTCQRPAWQRSQPVVRMRGRRLQRARLALLSKQPWCVPCLKRGIRTISTIRDHIIPLAEGGADDDTNVQAICEDCHDAKTREESRRGIQRGANR